MGKSANKPREAAEIGAFMVRMCRAMVRRAEAGELEALTELRRVRRELDAAIRASIRASAEHYSYSTIAAECGVSKQTIHQTIAGRAGRGRAR